MSGTEAGGPQLLHLMRVTIEATAPLSLASGEVEDVTRRVRRDGTIKEETKWVVALVRDANGLPTIPGSTLQGVLRRLFALEHGEAAARDLFGYAVGETGKAGRLAVGFGTVHDRRDRAVTGLVTDAAAITGDAVLKTLRAAEPTMRDHVALNARGVADGRRKFDRRAVPAGARFSVEFALWGEAAEAERDGADLKRIVRLFGHPLFRLGGAGRSGYGRIALVRASRAAFDLADPRAVRRVRGQQPSVGLRESLMAEAGIDTAPHAVTIRLRLVPVNPWRIGGGRNVSLTEGTHGTRKPDGKAPKLDWADVRQGRQGNERRERDAIDLMTALREPVIRWANGVGELREPLATSAFDAAAEGGVAFTVPGSAIKGPLAHRALFHWNRGRPGMEGMIDVAAWLARSDDERKEALRALRALGERPEELAGLLGAAKQRGSDDGRAGHVFVEDGAVTAVRAVQAMDHNSIDRFTGGVRPGALFTEEVLVGGAIAVAVTVSPPPGAGDWPAKTRDAFLLALRDLCRGRLAVGAKSLGFCDGTVTGWEGAEPMVSAWRSAWDGILAGQPGRDAA